MYTVGGLPTGLLGSPDVLSISLNPDMMSFTFGLGHQDEGRGYFPTMRNVKVSGRSEL